MIEDRRTAGTLGNLVASRRRHRFVGRASEVELFRVALDSTEPPFSVLHVYGPAGIGKTSLLEVFADLAADAGARVIRLDGRDLIPSPSALLEALSGFGDVHDGEEAITEPSRRVVVLLDTYEQLALLDGWVRTHLIPRLPATALTVIAGRTAPGPGWRADPGWRDLLRVVSLRNLRPEESRAYLQGSDVDVSLHDRLVEITHGHPLGLSLVADVVSRGGGVAFDPLTPQLVGTLLQQFVDVVPSGLQRRALEVCALARVTSETLLRDALDLDNAHDLFAWLRGLSFVESGPDGLFPHDLARDVLDVDLRWRDLEGYKQVFRSVRAHIHGRLRSVQGNEQLRALFDLKFLFRNLPSILSPVDWEAWGRHYPEPARAEDRRAIIDLALAWEGEESAAIAERWLDHQPEAFFVIRWQDGSVRGFLALLELTRASAQDIAADPGAQAALNYAQDYAPRPGPARLSCSPGSSSIARPTTALPPR